jgi:hypothetical protein
MIGKRPLQVKPGAESKAGKLEFGLINQIYSDLLSVETVDAKGVSSSFETANSMVRFFLSLFCLNEESPRREGN